jgi:hypothetical protein
MKHFIFNVILIFMLIFCAILESLGLFSKFTENAGVLMERIQNKIWKL